MTGCCCGAADVKDFTSDAYAKLKASERTLFPDIAHMFSRAVQCIQAKGGQYFFGTQ